MWGSMEYATSVGVGVVEAGRSAWSSHGDQQPGRAGRGDQAAQAELYVPCLLRRHAQKGDPSPAPALPTPREHMHHGGATGETSLAPDMIAV
eukprot:253954-Hanusia_phi.AAC.2